MKYTFIEPLPKTMEAIRTKEATLTCKVSHARAPVKWLKNKEEISVRFCLESLR